MELNLNKLDEVLFIFGNIIPLGSLEKQAQLQNSMNLNMNIDQAVQIFMRAIHTMMKEKPDVALGYLDFIRQAIEYVFEERKELPEVDNSDEVLKRKMLIFHKTRKEFQ